MKKTKEIIHYHYTAPELLSPQHPVTVKVIGCGGTGSQMLNNLARLHHALKALGHPGLHVNAFDADEITEANLGRQLFSPAELGMNKAAALITRINRFYGMAWEATPTLFDMKDSKIGANILITCVDNVKIRKEIGKVFEIKAVLKSQNYEHQPERRNYYWLDLGNGKTSGQAILGTRGGIEQPKKTKNTVAMLPCITEMFPDLEKHEKADQGPSCSLAEALEKQDLFINSILAQYGANLIWKMFRNLRIEHHGVYLNLETMNTNPIKVK